MINFKLENIDNINPIGQEPNLKISWFWLTEAKLWIKLGNSTIYEYTEEAIKYFEITKKHCEYPLIRFIEDLLAITEQISEDVPDKFFNQTNNIQTYIEKVGDWLNKFEEDFDLYLDNEDILMSWINSRTLTSSHLVGGTEISFFRNKDKIRIIWFTDKQLDNGNRIWTAKSSFLEMPYNEFVNEIKAFKTTFFQEMDNQVLNAIAKDWGNIFLDKRGLIEEHNERKIEFDSKVNLLGKVSTKNTDWNKIEKLHEEIK